ncbi:MAG: DUF6896 domain-containing protein [Coprobacillaceae bacterium]
MDEKLIELLKEYIEKVNSVKPVMFNDFHVQTKKQLIEKRLSFTIGEFKVKSNNKYRFHGRGCNFSNEEFEIDWDFGFYEIWCGINPGLFFYYLITNYKVENNVSNYNMIQNFIKKMVKQKVLVSKYDLYYFVEDIK